MDSWHEIVLDFILDIFKWAFDFLRSIEFLGTNMLSLMVIFIIIGFIVNAFISSAPGVYNSIKGRQNAAKAESRRQEYRNHKGGGH